MAPSKRRSTLSVLSVLVFSVGSMLAACSSSDDDGAPPATGGRGSVTAGRGSAGDPEAGGAPDSGTGAVSSRAGNGPLAGASGVAGSASTRGAGVCDNGLDDDGDGLVDGFDPECTGPLDNDEGSFATGIPGDNRDPKWQDCFFDGNSGAGDDGCRYHTDCLYGKLSADHANCQVTEECLKACRPLTQNGCDCFGCCTVELPNGSTVDIVEAATCSLADLGDAEKCPRCVKSTQCQNDCGECELCPGKTALPATCTPQTPPPGEGGAGGTSGTGGSDSGGAPNDPPPSHTCDNGEQVCGEGLPPCAHSYEYCSFGCCITAIR